eukprot:15362354-Ditylum_brightwellii.AAC.1
MNILEYGVPAAWRREFNVQGFDPVDQGLKIFVEFCTCLESYELSADKPKDKKSSKSKIVRKCKDDMTTKPASEKKFYCDLHGCNMTHNTKGCYNLKQRTKGAKQVTNALKKAKKKFKKEKKDKQVELNAFDKFCMLNVNKSSNDKDKQDAHVFINVDDSSNSNSNS